MMAAWVVRCPVVYTLQSEPRLFRFFDPLGGPFDRAARSCSASPNDCLDHVFSNGVVSIG